MFACVLTNHERFLYVLRCSLKFWCVVKVCDTFSLVLSKVTETSEALSDNLRCSEAL